MPAIMDHLRVLRNAAHWAERNSPAVAEVLAAYDHDLGFARTEHGAIVLYGRDPNGSPVSLCLTQEKEGPALSLAHSQLVAAQGYRAIRSVNITVTLPRYLAAQVARLFGPDTPPPDHPQPDLVPA
jgi:hypothetical protein